MTVITVDLTNERVLNPPHFVLSSYVPALQPLLITVITMLFITDVTFSTYWMSIFQVTNRSYLSLVAAVRHHLSLLVILGLFHYKRIDRSCLFVSHVGFRGHFLAVTLNGPHRSVAGESTPCTSTTDTDVLKRKVVFGPLCTRGFKQMHYFPFFPSCDIFITSLSS